jgi:hypothetical protein
MTSKTSLATGVPALTRGHFRSLELLENTPAARETLHRYERALGSPVYLRPTDKGLTVISLDVAPLAMVGVGPTKGSCSLTVMPPSEAEVSASVAGYRTKVAAMKRRSPEERYIIGRIRTALGAALQLDEGLLFLHQEWRFTSAGKLDLLALDQNTGQLVVIEAKQSEALALDLRTAQQGRTYVDLLTASWADYVVFFQRLASALSHIYQRTVPPSLDPSLAPRSEVWWPGGSRRTSPGG